MKEGSYFVTLIVFQQEEFFLCKYKKKLGYEGTAKTPYLADAERLCPKVESMENCL
jgi:hypothetical protein